MTGGHRPIAVLLTLAFLVLLALGLVMGTAWALGLLGRLDTCLAAILLDGPGRRRRHLSGSAGGLGRRGAPDPLGAAATLLPGTARRSAGRG